MALQLLPGSSNLWFPEYYIGRADAPSSRPSFSATQLDANNEEVQFIGRVRLEDPTASAKTFSTASKLWWMTGTITNFSDDGAFDPTLRIGVKQASDVSTTTGPPAQATTGAAAFDVYTDLVGGTDTLSSNTAYDTTMANGSLSVANGDLICIAFHLTEPAGGSVTPIVNIRSGAVSTALSYPAATSFLPSAAAVGTIPICVMTFEDGTRGWIDGSLPFSSAVTTTSIGNGNHYGNVFQVPFPCKVDAVILGVVTGGGNFNVELLSTPLGTPAVMSGGSLSFDSNIFGANAHRTMIANFASPIQLSANTDYAIAVKQTTATSVSMSNFDVDNANHWKAWGGGTAVYAATSTAGAAFSQLNSGKRRAQISLRISHLDDGAGGGSSGLTSYGFAQ